MNNARRILGLLRLTLAAASTACGGVTIEEMCQRQTQECGEDAEHEQACIQSGQIFRDQAEEKGCSGAFDAYIDCVGDSGDICDEAAIVEECGLLQDAVPCLKEMEESPASHSP
ncbi:MAG: hypothetical protein HOW73_11590 [Polyangiaceae bacterium]|nr:hypothetical protein [Polyangiaceae bacterium]